MDSARRRDYAKICADIARSERRITNDAIKPAAEVGTALHKAAEAGDAAMSAALLDAGADPFALDACGYTPLHCAVIYEHLDVCRAFELKYPGISVKRSGSDRTPLGEAVSLGRTEVVEILVLEFGADLDHSPSDRSTLSDLAHGNEYMMKLLQSLRTEVAARRGFGTPAIESSDQRRSRPDIAL